MVAESVANAPGGPIHVLVSDREAEHIPGCNMAFRTAALRALGGFDPTFRAAGDDVDVCWRLRDRGWRIGFNPAAVVWHRRHDSVRAYWRLQRGYSEAEALVERKWPERHNGAGHPAWNGRIYGPEAQSPSILGRRRIHYGKWGSALFQSLYEHKPPLLAAMPLMALSHEPRLELAGAIARRTDLDVAELGRHDLRGVAVAVVAVGRRGPVGASQVLVEL